MPTEPNQVPGDVRDMLCASKGNAWAAMLWAEGITSLASGRKAAADGNALRSLLNSLDAGIVITDATTQIVYANRAMVQLTGHSAADLARLMPLASWRLQHMPGSAVSLPTTWEGDTVWRDSVLIEAADGHHATASCAIYPLRDESDDLVCLVAVLRDRTAQARSTQLDAMGYITGSIAHDLNNLLTVQVAYCQMLVEDLEPGSPNHHKAVRIQQSVQRLALLSEKLMLSSGRIAPGPNVLDIGEVLIDIQDQLRQIATPDIEMDLSVAPTPMPVRASAEHLETLLINLVTNGAAAAGPGGKIMVQAQRRTLEQPAHGLPAGEYALLAVSDTGPGLTPDMVDHLYEPLYAHRGGGAGTGLGLSVARGIAIAHGGCIRLAQPKADEGARFEILLPLAN